MDASVTITGDDNRRDRGASLIDDIKTRIPVSAVFGRKLKLIRVGGEHKALCPFHADTDPSLTINDEKGFYKCFSCGAYGDVVDAAEWLYGSRDAALAVLKEEAGLGRTPAPQPDAQGGKASKDKLAEKQEKARKRAIEFWGKSEPLASDQPQAAYLASRKIWLSLMPSSLRALDNHQFWMEDKEQPQRVDGSYPQKLVGRFPVVACKVTDTAGKQIAIWRIYVTDDGVALAKARDDIGESKKGYGPAKGGMVLLTEPAGTLVVAEGVETALSVLKALKDLEGIAVGATLSTSGMMNLQLPDWVERLVIMADHDPEKQRKDGSIYRPGELAAETLARRKDVKLPTSIAYPEIEGDDWNDVLRISGPEKVREAYERALDQLMVALPNTEAADQAALPQQGRSDSSSTKSLDNEPAANSPDVDPRPPTYSDDALAMRFTERYANDLRYIAQWGKWRRWDGTRWAEENTKAPFDWARGICRVAANELRRLNSDSSARIATRVAAATTVAAVERMAQADRAHAAIVDQWDCDPLLLNTPTGIVDLRTGEMQPHRRDAYMTKSTSIAPEWGDRSADAWLAFLERITDGNAQLMDYLQRVAGYCLSGLTHEHALFFGFGTGGNGKGVFINTLTRIMGDYAKVAGMETFTASLTDRHPTELAVLQGARLVSAQETEEGRRWAESRIKALTGGDPITARFMRQDPFTFEPQFKLFLAGNHKPGLRGVDEAMRRRFHLIPFTVTIPPKERDVRLPEKLMDEAPAILAWAIEGFRNYQTLGLAPPDVVRGATEAYLEAEDFFGQWLTDRCRTDDAQLWDHSSALFSDFKTYAEKAGEFSGSQRRFGQTLEARGFLRARDGQGRMIYRGLRLEAPSQEGQPYA